MTDNIGLADIAAVTGNDGNFGNNGWWIIILFFAIMMNGGWGNNGFQNAIGYENLATSNEVQRGFDNQNSMANQREILSAVNAGTAQSVAAVNQSFHDMIAYNGDKYNEITRDIAGLAVGQANSLANQNQCCCDTKMLISETAANQRYESAQQTSQLMQAIQAEGAATRELMQQDKIEALQQRVNQLQLEQQMAGVVRYPNGFVYNAGSNPFCGCGNWGGCCGNNI